MDIGPGTRRREPEAFGDPGLEGGRPVITKRLLPVGITQLQDDATVYRVPDPEQIVEVRISDQVAERLVGEPRHTAGTER